MSLLMTQKRLITQSNIELRAALIEHSKEFMAIFEFDYIAYSRFYFSGKRLVVINDLDVFTQYSTLDIEADIQSFIDYYTRFQQTKPNTIYTHPWPTIPSNPNLQLLHHLGYVHGFNFYIRCADSIVAFHLGTRSSSYLLTDLYLNNLDLIHDFIFFLHKKLEHFTEKHIYTYDIAPVIAATRLPFTPDFISSDRELQLRTLRESFFLDTLDKNMPNHSHSKFSSRERQCLSLIIRGYSTKEAAKQLGLSPRTVETYISNLKSKAGVKSKFDLIKLISD